MVVFCFQQLSMVVVITGFFFSFLFHWGTVEPLSSTTDVGKEAAQGQLRFV